jgi:catechol 2,3-dioxygenase-like lactoylglutathione lyase family enzyme
VIQHVALETREDDIDAEVAFWALLAFAHVEAPGTLTERSTWLQGAAGTQVHLLHAPDPTAPPEGHVAIIVPDYDATLARLRDAGFDPQPRPAHWGAQRSFVRSPGGHRVEVMAAPPPSAPRRGRR